MVDASRGWTTNTNQPRRSPPASSQRSSSPRADTSRANASRYPDANGGWLDGARDYTLHVPANPPAKLFGSVTVYDADTRC